MNPQLGCSCKDCTRLAQFLADRDAQALNWPLAKDRRQHIHGVLDGTGVPVTHTTLRIGSPHLLQLRKLPGIVKKEAHYRRWLSHVLRRLDDRLGKPAPAKTAQHPH